MPPKFKLLLNNPCLQTVEYQPLESSYLSQHLGMPLYLPQTKPQPSIFSCFALSVDGKLCYPDLKSGYAIAKMNLAAQAEERYADWWNLVLGRTISDAVIIGSNSLLLEQNSYSAEIDISEFRLLRNKLNKPAQLLHILITRDLTKINFEQEPICQNKHIPLLIYCLKRPLTIPANFIACQLDAMSLNANKQLVYTDEKTIDLPRLISKLYQLGIRRILNESPYYHHQLQQFQLLNEAWINTSALYIGGSVAHLGQNSPAFSAMKHPHYTILSLHNIAYNFLYTRYRIDY